MSYEESELLKLYEEQYTGRLFEKAVSYLNERNALFDERDELNKEIDRLDTILDKLEQENKQLKDNIRQMDNSVDKLQKQLIKEKDNWNKLKEYLEEWKENEEYCYLASSPIDRCRKDIYGEILDKIQGLEQGSDSNGQ